MLRERRAAAAACAQWKTAMTGMFEAYPVDSAAVARRRSWLRGAPLISARVWPVFAWHAMPGPSRGIRPIMAGSLFILAQFSKQIGEKATRQNAFVERI